jgi:DNA-binding XRE family transcriptional regulator
MNKIKQFRLKKKLNQVEFSKELGVNQGTISKAEKGSSMMCVIIAMRKRYGFNVNLFIDKEM